MCKNNSVEPGVAVHPYYPTTWVTEVGGLPEV